VACRRTWGAKDRLNSLGCCDHFQQWWTPERRASSEMNMHRIPMWDRTLLTSGAAGEDTVVKTGEEWIFPTSERFLSNLPCKTLLRQILAEVQNNPYYPRYPRRCKERVRDQWEVQIKLVIDDIDRKNNMFLCRIIHSFSTRKKQCFQTFQTAEK
jgi:hypothetical protein